MFEWVTRGLTCLRIELRAKLANTSVSACYMFGIKMTAKSAPMPALRAHRNDGRYGHCGESSVAETKA